MHCTFHSRLFSIMPLTMCNAKDSGNTIYRTNLIEIPHLTHPSLITPMGEPVVAAGPIFNHPYPPCVTSLLTHSHNAHHPPRRSLLARSHHHHHLRNKNECSAMTAFTPEVLPFNFLESREATITPHRMSRLFVNCNGT